MRNTRAQNPDELREPAGKSDLPDHLSELTASMAVMGLRRMSWNHKLSPQMNKCNLLNNSYHETTLIFSISGVL